MKLLRALLTTTLIATTSSGCFLFGPRCCGVAFTGGVSSPAVYGVDVRYTPRFTEVPGTVAFHPVLGYSRSLFGGVDGETLNTLHLGAQLRSRALTPGGVWIGGEAAYARRWTSFDQDGIDTETTNGWTLAGLFGVPLTPVLHGYVAGGLNKYGGTGAYGRIGFEIHR